jgi:succinate dehydrogenase / fumarate reductase cytochrome b subunit
VAVAADVRPARKLKAGRIYKGKSGMWSFILHRVTGIAILGFLILHILGESFMGVSQEAFNTIEDLYKNFFFRLSELGLLFALVYHAVNGLRITLIDFFPSLTARIKELQIVQWVLTAGMVIPAGVIMLNHYFKSR